MCFWVGGQLVGGDVHRNDCSDRFTGMWQRVVFLALLQSVALARSPHTAAARSRIRLERRHARLKQSARPAVRAAHSLLSAHCRPPESVAAGPACDEKGHLATCQPPSFTHPPALMLAHPAGHPECVTAVLAYDADSVLTGSSDGLIRILSIQPNRMLGVLGEHSGAAGAPGFRAASLICPTRGVQRVWG